LQAPAEEPDKVGEQHAISASKAGYFDLAGQGCVNP